MAMSFRRREPEEPEINLIPFIDVLLVILIFLMLSTTYSKFTELQVTLPVADAERCATTRARSSSPSLPTGATRSIAEPSRGAASTCWPPSSAPRLRDPRTR